MTVGPAAYWRIQISGWALYGAANAPVALWVAHLSVVAAVCQAVGLAALGVGLSHLLYGWIRHKELLKHSLRIRITHVLLFSVLISVPAGILARTVNLAPWQTADLKIDAGLRWVVEPLAHALNWTLLLLIWAAVYFSLRSFRE